MERGKISVLLGWARWNRVERRTRPWLVRRTRSENVRDGQSVIRRTVESRGDDLEGWIETILFTLSPRFNPPGKIRRFFTRRIRRRRSFIHYFFSLPLFRIIRIYVHSFSFLWTTRKKSTFSYFSSSCFFAREEFLKKSTLIPTMDTYPGFGKSISFRQRVFQMEELFRRDTIAWNRD